MGVNMITNEEKQNLVDFFNACDEMIEGRFILSDTKVSNILKSVVKSEILYKLYSDCMQDFRKEYGSSRDPVHRTGGGRRLPLSADPISPFLTPWPLTPGSKTPSRRPETSERLQKLRFLSSKVTTEVRQAWI